LGLPFADILAWTSAKPLELIGSNFHIAATTHHFAQSGALLRNRISFTAK